VKLLPWIVTILLLLDTTRSTAQLWKYLDKYDPKAALAFEKTLDSEALFPRYIMATCYL